MSTPVYNHFVVYKLVVYLMLEYFPQPLELISLNHPLPLHLHG